ncbi:hypothetical protein [Natronomonas marina]|uniref:hypothetical protein n=1 Tax=Natronomonas marina TaxID=2961939 RepID=UPI0020C9E030|nr:hypothetical protein [Natronomonas marina]
MVEWSGTEERLCGFGDSDRTSLDVEGWQPGGNPPALSARVDATAVGSLRAIRLPDGEPLLARGATRRLDEETLPEGVHEVAVDAGLETRVAFEGPASVEDEAGGAWLRFPEPTPVTVGFRESRSPREMVTVPATAAGLATAVTAASRTHRTAGPERSHPGYRPRTPRVAFGHEARTDLAPDDDRPTVTVPERPTAVLVAAPLAYYIGADVETGDGPPTLRADGFRHTFDPLPAFAEAVGGLLRGLCALDVRLRSVPGETGALSVGVGDAERLRAAPPVERLRAVVESDADLGWTWPLATYVDDDVENGRYLPYLLDRLSLVHPAAASELDPQALLKRSLDEFFRGETASVEAVDPSLADGRFHAWRGEGTPVEAFTLLGTGGAGIEASAEAGFDVDVVCNDEAMRSEGAVAEVYRRRLAGRSVDVRVHERLTTAELSALLERPTDLVHFIGHCEVDGVVCPDGHLAAADLETCGTEAFFLNACGSYHEGYDLVRRGATVGAVTLTTVLDEQAVAVGTIFAELLAGGFAFDRAMSLARGEIIAGRDYVVVGDGTHRLRPPRGDAGVFDVERTDDGFAVGYDATAPDGAGRRYRDPFDDCERACGVPTRASLAPAELRDLFERHRSPVRYEGELRWTDDLAREMTDL